MIESMTGFGSSTAERNGLSVTIEIRSVNSRFFDLSLKLSQGLEIFEKDIRRIVKEECRRGNISLSVSMDRDSSGFGGEVRFDKDRFETYLSLLETINQDYNTKIDIENVLDIRELISIVKVGEIEQDDIINVLVNAIQELRSMRLKEGEVIAQDLGNRIDHLDSILLEIQKISTNSISDMTDLYKRRIKEILSDNKFNLDENRILQETAILAEKLDVTEECVRCKSHLDQFKGFLLVEDPVGKRLNFILQELFREINTIGSKTNQIDITQRIIEMKDEVEKIKEQVQNVL